jgi:hypothetical protein
MRTKTPAAPRYSLQRRRACDEAEDITDDGSASAASVADAPCMSGKAVTSAKAAVWHAFFDDKVWPMLALRLQQKSAFARYLKLR